MSPGQCKQFGRASFKKLEGMIAAIMEGCAHQDRGQTRNGKPDNGCVNKMLTAEISENILNSTSQHPRGEEHPIASPAMPRRVVGKPPGTAMGGGSKTEGT